MPPFPALTPAPGGPDPPILRAALPFAAASRLVFQRLQIIGAGALQVLDNAIGRGKIVRRRHPDRQSLVGQDSEPGAEALGVRVVKLTVRKLVTM
jgi:hypothetical protein